MPENPWIYFGAHERAGHYLHFQGRRSRDEVRQYDDMAYFDGQLCHADTKARVARLTRLPRIGYSALAFWDYSVDTRGGSNSIIFAPSMDLSAEEIVAGADEQLSRFRTHWLELDLGQAQKAHVVDRNPRDRRN